VELIASGLASHVYALDDRTVLRRGRFGADTSPEARLMRHVREHGFPAPEVHAAEGGDLIMERLYGPTLGEALFAGHVDAAEAAAIQLDLHERLHRIAVPEWLGTAPRGIDLSGGTAGSGMAGNSSADSGPADSDAADRGAAAGGTADEAATPAILHLDLHPLNIVLTDAGPCLVDWTNAAAGDPRVDLAVSWAILAGADLVGFGLPAATAEAVRSALIDPLRDGIPESILDAALRFRRADPNVDDEEWRRVQAQL
jgi:aminoglycoside phosphotransferase (APT) family kinase protein